MGSADEGVVVRMADRDERGKDLVHGCPDRYGGRLGGCLSRRAVVAKRKGAQARRHADASGPDRLFEGSAREGQYLRRRQCTEQDGGNDAAGLLGE